MKRLRLLLVAGFGLGLLAVGVAWLAWPRHAFSGTLQDSPAPDFALTDESGQPFTLSALRGQWILLFYGYTTCPDVCPATLSELKRVKAQLGPQSDQVRVVFVSVDPERDSVPVMEKYVHHFGADFKGLTGSATGVAAAAQAYGVKYQKQDIQTAVGYLVTHSAYLYLIDPQFRWRVTFPFGVQPQEITDDLRYLMTHPEAQP